VFVDASRTLGRFTPELSVRTDYFDRFGQRAVDPRAGLRIDLPSQQHVRLAVGEYHQAPSDRYYSSGAGTTELSRMSATHVVAGYELGSFGNASFVRVEAYAKRYHDLPLQGPTSGFTSAGYGSASGVDVFVKRTVKHVAVRASASALRARRRWTPFDEQNRF